jgi:hypothetical protein
MLIDSEQVKKTIRDRKQHTYNDIAEQCFNKGLDVAIEQIEIIEEVEEVLTADE